MSRKKILSLMFCAALTVSIFGAEFKEGTYVGEAKGYRGEIKVEVKTSKNKIEEVKVVKNTDTPIISDAAAKKVPEQIVKYQSLRVDGVSGATGTSRALTSAVRNALKNSGADLKELNKKPVIESKKLVKETQKKDVVVIGAGGAGLIAAIEAKNNGAQNVIVLEKMAFAGGNTLISGGEYAAPNNWVQVKKGLKDSNDTFYNDILKGGDNEGNPKLVRVLADNALNGAEWLKDYINMTFEDRQMFFGGHSVERSLVPLGATGVEMISKLLAKAEELNIPVLYETPAVELIVDKGRVTGVKALSEDKEYTFLAKDGVILASGGFGSNLEMRVKYNKDVDENILSTNTVGITGDGITMAEKIGAQLEDMPFIQTYPTCDPISGALLYFGDVRLIGGSILINQEGKRFVEELERRDVISMAIKNQTGNAAYQFCDEAQVKLSGVAEHHADEMNYLFNNKLLVKADTIKEAADFFGIDAAELEKTVEKYNQYAKDGKDLEFNKRGKLTPFEAKGPFYIMKAVPAVHHTMGGVKIDENARVINTKGEIIKGLYGAGEVTGDIHGTNRLGSDAIADITVFGRIAGQNVVKDNK
ncbi:MULTISPECIES: flavocytochrome c [Fusobacterium]|jgi:urocanate reductase|uniref:Urocanate reductase n=1 Tax=Fusobacterium varium ATCC 27725 TaxID=469618 RepID=A0ABN5JJN8_FUSVA|nr:MULTISPECIES: flavocytochrome c [Fusobacterium]AVQ31369.1 flavocytochrome c [Fusobacterium varium ATCC 27725]EES62695.1 putative fumarate reductase flavoprotein subunit [Fusobacterium varium ATCC 27725]MCF2673032.1 flavocytochrome c [Fusobacterium varium]RHG36851.1 flavocytochrome c [Fusobacterium varium]HBJ78589.1 flavocytochrome c [Fusobacterium sp.]